MGGMGGAAEECVASELRENTSVEPEIFSDTSSETFFRYQFVPISVLIPPKKITFPSTGTSHYGGAAEECVASETTRC